MNHGDGSSSGRTPGCDPGDGEFNPPLSPQDLYWIAGLLEGGGSFLPPAPSPPPIPLITIEMTDRDVRERFARLVGVWVRPDQRHIPNQSEEPTSELQSLF